MMVQIDLTTFLLVLVVIPELSFIAGYIISSELFIKRIERGLGKKWQEVKQEWKHGQ